MAGMELRVFTEPQQGASYDDLLRVAQKTEELGFGAFFRSDHFLGVRHRRAARPDRCVGDARRTGPRDQHHPPRHPGDERDVPVAGSAGGPGGAGRPDERRARRAGHRRGMVRPRARGVRRPVPRHRASASRCSRSRSRSSPGCGRPRAGTASRASTTRIEDSPGLPKPHQAKPPVIIGGAGKRVGGAGGPVRRRVQRALQGVRGGPGRARPGPAGVRGRRPRPGLDDLLQRAGAVRRQGRGGVRAPRRQHRPRPRDAARRPSSAAP